MDRDHPRRRIAGLVLYGDMDVNLPMVAYATREPA
jgi:hypothetical protein